MARKRITVSEAMRTNAGSTLLYGESYRVQEQAIEATKQKNIFDSKLVIIEAQKSAVFAKATQRLGNYRPTSDARYYAIKAKRFEKRKLHDFRSAFNLPKREKPLLDI